MEIKNDLALMKDLLQANHDLLLTPTGQRAGFPK